MSTARAIGIVRVSQRDDETTHSPETQARAMLKLASTQGWSLDPDDILDENDIRNGDVSGGADLIDRPGLKRAVEAIERGEASVIVAERFDRFFRDLDIQRQVISRVEAAGGRMVTAAGVISHATAEAELNANLNGSIAQYMRRTSKERSWAAVEVAIEEGKIPWSQTAPGYLRGADGKLTPDLELKRVIKRAFKMRAEGATIDAVRAFLQDHGIERSYHGTRHLLRDRVYIGQIHFGSHTPNLSAHKPIIDSEVFDRVQRIAVSRGRRSKSDRLLARLGVLRCASCGSRMVVGTANNSGYWIYRCPPVGDCQRRVTISAEMVEAAVAAKVKKERSNLRGRASADDHYNHAVAERDRWEDIRAKRLGKAIYADAEDDPITIQAVNDAKAERDRWQAEVDRLKPARDSLEIDVDVCWDEADLAQRRALVLATIKSVTVKPGRGPDRLSFELLGE